MLYTQVTEQLSEAAKLPICISDAFSLNLDCAMKYPNMKYHNRGVDPCEKI